MSRRAERHIHKARRRILNMANRSDLKTIDPVMVEIKLAELDATLALVYATQEQSESISILVNHLSRLVSLSGDLKAKVEPTIPFYLTSRINKVDRQVQDILERLERESEIERGQSASASDAPWWVFWRDL